MKKVFLTLAVVVALASMVSCACNNTASEAVAEEEATECCEEGECCCDGEECACEDAEAEVAEADAE